MDQMTLDALRSIVGQDKVLTGDDAVIVKDCIGFRRYERHNGLENAVPKASCVVKVQSTGQVSEVLKLLNEKKIPTAPRTGGSSVTLGIEPEVGGVILDGSDMNEILELNERDMMVTVRCGTPLAMLESWLNERGYTTGHYPQSLPLAHVGGLLATRSIGQLSTLYGGIEDMVVGLEAVLPTGEIVRIKNNPRRSVGPDLRHIFIGNEGAFAFITEATLKLWKFMPENRWMRAYGIKGMQNGLDLLREIMVAGYKPAVARLFDPVENVWLQRALAPEGWSLLYFMAEGPAPITKATGDFIEEAIKKYEYVDLGVKPMEHWLIHRNDVCNEMETASYLFQQTIADTCEISAPWSIIGDIHAAVLERMPREMENLVAIGGHSSHSYMQGTNVYFTFAFTVRSVETAREDYMKVISVIMEETLKRGGSIAHHHGSGKYRTQWMPEEHGSSFVVMKALKKALDPNGIMNPNTIVPKE